MTKSRFSFIKSLQNGGIGVMPTDTMYGIVGSALNKRAVDRIYKVRQRDLDKPLIILIDSIDRLKDFGISLSSDSRKVISKIWPDMVSVILPSPQAKFKYLHRGTGKLAFRLPDNRGLRSILKKTGPLVAPSANIQGKDPARTIKGAQGYFGTNIDFYVDGGRMKTVPSTIIEIADNGKASLVREGAVKVGSKKLKTLLQ